MAGPAGGVDLFQAFSDHAGTTIGLQECLYRLPGGGVIAVYLVPLDRAGPFTRFLDAVMVPMPDGSVVVPVHARAGQVGLRPDVDPAVAAALDGCHLIGSATFSPDDPRTIAARRHTSAAKPGRTA